MSSIEGEWIEVHTKFENLLILWRQLMRSPRQLGTVAPSSGSLGNALIAAAELEDGMNVVVHNISTIYIATCQKN